GLAATGAAADQCRSSPRQAAAGDLVEPLDPGRGLRKRALPGPMGTPISPRVPRLANVRLGHGVPRAVPREPASNGSRAQGSRVVPPALSGFSLPSLERRWRE